MIFWTVKHVVISLVFILLIHYIYNFFKNNLTIPKVKDLVSKPQQQYNKIFDVMKNSKENQLNNNININKNNNNNNVVETTSSTNMKTELKKYLNNLQKKQDDIQSVGMNFDNSYDTYNKY
tara:strand:- start:566 stop:928 length:363 start_codon:yes stop_codon:yes gene_type:complete